MHIDIDKTSALDMFKLFILVLGLSPNELEDWETIHGDSMGDVLSEIATLDQYSGYPKWVRFAEARPDWLEFDEDENGKDSFIKVAVVYYTEHNKKDPYLAIRDDDHSAVFWMKEDELTWIESE